MTPRPFADLSDEELRNIAEMNPLDTRTIGGDFLDEEGNPTGWKVRGNNERRVMARIEARRELAARVNADASASDETQGTTGEGT